MFLKLTAEIFLKKGCGGSPYARSKEAGESQSSRHWDPGMNTTALSPGAHYLGGRQRKISHSAGEARAVMEVAQWLEVHRSVVFQQDSEIHAFHLRNSS